MDRPLGLWLGGLRSCSACGQSRVPTSYSCEFSTGFSRNLVLEIVLPIKMLLLRYG